MALDLDTPGYRRMLALYGGAELEGVRRRVRERKRASTRAEKPRRRVGKKAERPGRMPGGADERMVAGRWEVTARIGRGNYGEVFRGRDVTTGTRVAVKLAAGIGMQLLQVERGAYRVLNADVACVPRLWYAGRWGGGGVLVMGLCGRSLEMLRQRCGGKLALKTVLMLGIQMTRGLEMIHAKGLLHRDVKPDNLLMERRRKQTVYVVDFGLSGAYREPGGRHVRGARAGFVGTLKYASEHVHAGSVASRRDDLISLAYTMVYLFHGTLPWKDGSVADVGKQKRRIDPRRLCNGMGAEMCKYLEHVRQLPFAHRPDYVYLVWLLENALRKRGWSNDHRFEWTS